MISCFDPDTLTAHVKVPAKHDHTRSSFTQRAVPQQPLCKEERMTIMTQKGYSYDQSLQELDHRGISLKARTDQ